MFKTVPSARTKAESEPLRIAPTSSPTIGNTLVVRSFFSLSLSRFTCSALSYIFNPLILVIF